ncbi:MAG: radical SAM protein [Dehalococcoidia bacterium]|nr:radical SAM protein [Dehalococcoidia bacterium]
MAHMTWEAAQEARKRLAREQGTIVKDWGGKIAVALVYPNSYRVGMSNLGLQTLYKLFNSHRDIVCERVFWEGRPTPQKTSLLSLETQRPLTDFPVLAFTVSYELDYFNIVQVQKASGIPPLAADRNEEHPLIIGGGPCLTANPEPLSLLFDAIAIGEGEAIAPGLLEVITEGVSGSREELRRALAAVPGIYVPGESQSVARQWAADIDSFATTSVALTPDTELGDMYLMEIARGCGRGCRFCLAGFAFRPFRTRSLPNLLAQARVGLTYRKRLGLVGAAVSDHPELERLVTELRVMGAGVGVSSLRIKPLSETVLRAIAESGTQTVTLAPEAGSERLRRAINKSFTGDDILSAIDKAAGLGLRQIKLYFMVGLPGETDDDVRDLITLVRSCLGLLERRQAGTRLTLNVGPFVPKAGTPFQWRGMAPADVLEGRLKMIRADLKHKGVEIKPESVGWSQVQAVLSRGDPRLGRVLAGLTKDSLAAWGQALEQEGIELEADACRELTAGDKLPWDVVSSGAETAYLRRELGRALGEDTPPA